MKQLTKEQAISLHDSKVWEDWTHEQLVRFQLFQDKLAIPFDKFQLAMERVLDRPVWTHEFANRESLILEYLGEKPAPTLDEIMSIIPEEKRIIILA